MLKQSVSLELDRVFHALSDATRRAVIARLAHGPSSVSELAKPLAMSLPAVVQHLAVLEQSGLVKSEKAGRVRTCRIEPEALKTVEHWVGEQRELWEARFDSLDAYVRILQDKEKSDVSEK